jgi:hypothetical protein
MKNLFLTLFALFVSLTSFSQCDNDTINPWFVNFQYEPTVSCDDDLNSIFPVVYDNCDDSVEIAFYEEVTQGSCEMAFDIFRVYRAYDDNGNQSVETQTIHIVDEMAPEFQPLSPIIIGCNESVLFSDPTVFDNCSSFSLTYQDLIDTSNYCQKVYTRIWTAQDQCDNMSTATQTVTIVDDVAPSFQPLYPILLNCSDPVIFDQPTVTDNCSWFSLMSYDSVDSTDNCQKVYTRVWTAQDQCDNISTVIQSITTMDIEPPTIIGEIQVILQPGDNLDSVYVTVTDNCSSVNLTYTDTEVSGNNVIRDYVATDVCGNTTAFEQIININNIIITPPPGDDDDDDDDDEDDDNNHHKVAICHGEGNGSYHTIYVNQNAVQAHLNHGDYLGPCTEMIMDWNQILPNSDLQMRVVKGKNNKFKKFVRVK